jgi:hypothetical protein
MCAKNVNKKHLSDQREALIKCGIDILTSYRQIGRTADSETSNNR